MRRRGVRAAAASPLRGRDGQTRETGQGDDTVRSGKPGRTTPGTGRGVQQVGRFSGDTVAAFAWDAHAHAMFQRQIMFAPLLVNWRYRVADAPRFKEWLALRDIVFSSRRLATDALLADVRYGGTYLLQPGGEADGADGAAATMCVTMWGFASEAARLAMEDLCSGEPRAKSIIQKDLVDFVVGLRTFMGAAGAKHFRAQTLLSAAVSPMADAKPVGDHPAREQAG